MDINYKLPDIVSLYMSDLRRYEHLSNSQELWLGIVIDSGRILETLLQDKESNDEKICDLLYIGIFNKIRELFDQLAKFSSPKSSPLIGFIAKTIEEIDEFKQTSKPVKRTILFEFFNAFPDDIHPLIFDLISFLWLLPSPILDLYQAEINQTQKIPSIANSLNVLNPLNTVYETKMIINRNNSVKVLWIESFLTYVKYFAYKYRNNGLDYEDVIQEGNLGLMKAVDKFDVRQRTKFKTFGLWWIRQSILRAIANDSRTVRFPVHLHERIEKFSRVLRRYQNNLVEEPSTPVLSEMSGLSVEEVTHLLEYTKPDISFEVLEVCENNLIQINLLSDPNSGLMRCKNCPFIEDESYLSEDPLVYDFESPFCFGKGLFRNYINWSNRGINIFNDITIDQNEDPLDSVQAEEFKAELQSVLDSLSPRISRVLKLRFGLEDGEKKSLDEVGQIMGVTRERIRQIEFNALRNIRIRKNYLRKYL